MEIQSVIGFLIIFFLFLHLEFTTAMQILSKSKLEKCERGSTRLECDQKIVVNIAVPSGSSGGESSIVVELVEVEENTTQRMHTVRIPPIITINKSAAYAVYELTYIRDVPYKPEEYYVKTRKCEPDASAKVVKICERLQDENGHIIEHTQPICCPCGPQRRAPSSCGSVFDKLVKGKANTAHCLRFPGDWFHVFGIGRRSLGFSVRIELKKGSKKSEVVVSPENRTIVSNDNFLRVNLIGDFVGYTSIPSFEDFYLVIPRQGAPGQPQNLGSNFSMWMLLERVRFSLDGLECNKIGVSYEAFNGQPNFCSSPLWSCLYNQLWNFWEADQNRISRNQLPQYAVERRFERINQHPNAGTHSFSIGITEVLNTDLLIELSADDIEFVYQRSPGKILSVTVPTFEALTQFGTATIKAKNIGKLEASYSLTFDCSRGITIMEEQFFIMKPEEIATHSFKLYPTSDQAAKYECSAILKDSNFNEVDRAGCQFTTTATVLDNGTQITPGPKRTSINGFFESIESIWNTMWDGVTDFFTGKTCRSKCSGFFDFSCHIQYICMGWVVMFILLLAILPTVLVLLWLLHQKGVFDPFYDWWEDWVEAGQKRNRVDLKHGKDTRQPHMLPYKDGNHLRHKHEGRHSHYSTHSKRQDSHQAHRKLQRQRHSELVSDYYHHHHLRAHKDRHKHKQSMDSDLMQQGYLSRKGKGESSMDEKFEHGMQKKRRETLKGSLEMTRHNEEKHDKHKKHKHGRMQDHLHSKPRTRITQRE